MDKKMEIDLSLAPIEIKIISSADAASHLIGPFYTIYWYEHPEKNIPELIEDNRKKAAKDWDRKMVLPEIKKIFEQRHRLLLENAGEFPDKFLSL
jgi:hypothetical protein